MFRGSFVLYNPGITKPPPNSSRLMKHYLPSVYPLSSLSTRHRPHLHPHLPFGSRHSRPQIGIPVPRASKPPSKNLHASLSQANQPQPHANHSLAASHSFLTNLLTHRPPSPDQTKPIRQTTQPRSRLLPHSASAERLLTLNPQLRL